VKLSEHIRGYFDRPLVRPWALAGPVLVLMLCLPLLRPLVEPDSRQWHDEEQMYAATTQAIVEQHSLAIDKSVFASNPVALRHEGHLYSPYPPMLPILLAPVYWVLLKQGIDYSGNLIFAQYLLIFLGSSIPIAVSVGLIYRLGRMFELHRALRVGLGLAAIVGGGVLCYGVVLNRHAPAVFLLLAAISCISHLAVSHRPQRKLIVASVAGFLAALAAAMDPYVASFAILLSLVLLAMRWPTAARCWSVMLYFLGAAPVVALNVILLHSAGLPASMALVPREPAPSHLSFPSSPTTLATAPIRPPTLLYSDEDQDAEVTGFQAVWAKVATWLGQFLEGLVGTHGILSHFPILILGLLGAVLVLHRNWTASTKAISALTLLSCLLLSLVYSFRGAGLIVSYGAPWFITISPALMLWSGAWLKRHHRPQSWVMAGLAMSFSLTVALVGMTNPMPRVGYPGYSFIEASARLLHGHPTPPSDLTR
jgi:hypothetical protein